MELVVNPNGVPRPGGSYSIVVRKGSLIFVSGLAGMDEKRRLVGDDIRSQTAKAIENLSKALAAVGSILGDVCSVSVYLADVERDYQAFDDVYRSYFEDEPPARVVVGVTIRGGALVAIQATAVVE